MYVCTMHTSTMLELLCPPLLFPGLVGRAAMMRREEKNEDTETQHHETTH